MKYIILLICSLFILSCTKEELLSYNITTIKITGTELTIEDDIVSFSIPEYLSLFASEDIVTSVNREGVNVIISCDRGIYNPSDLISIRDRTIYLNNRFEITAEDTVTVKIYRTIYK